MENKNNELKSAESSVLAREAARILIEKKALDVKMFNVEGKTSVTDFYVNATGRSSTQVASLADDVADIIGNKGRDPLRVEGRAGNTWILVDYGDVIVNVFDKQSREFYNLDRHLPQGSETDIADIIAEVDKKFDIKNEEEK